MLPLINLDVFNEILGHLAILMAEGAVATQEKRRTMLAVALTNSNLSRIALNALWKTMSTLEPIVQVFNASAPTIPVTYHDEGNYWTTPFSNNTMPSTLSRVNGYLARVQSIRLATFPSPKELSLWKMLLSLGNTPFVCPNLTKMSIGMSKADAPGLGHSLTPLISPALKTLILVNVTGAAGEEVALVLLDTSRYRGASLRRIHYQGFISQPIHQHFVQFPDLRYFSVHPTSMPRSSVSSMSNIKTLGALKHLTHFHIHLRCLLLGAGDTLSPMETLTTLELFGSWHEITGVIANYKSTSVESLVLSFESSTNPNPSPAINSVTDLFSLISSSYPNTHTLNISLQNPKTDQLEAYPCLSDIQRLKNLPIENLDLKITHHTLQTTDIIEIVKTWPTLKQLIINTPSIHGIFNAIPILEDISRCGTQLQSLQLPMEFRPLTDLASWSRLSPSCSLRLLDMANGSIPPQSLGDKIVLARRIVSLFPRLALGVSAKDKGTCELAAIMASNRGLLSAPPWTPDILLT